MARYVVMEPPGSVGAGREARIVEDGFAWLAFIVAPLWLLWHRLWVEAAVVVAMTVVIAVALDRFGHPGVGTALSLLLSVFVGLEGRSLWLASLRRRGWQEWGVLEAASFRDAEARYAFQAVPQPIQEGVAAPKVEAPPSHAPDRSAVRGSHDLLLGTGRL